MAGRGGGEGVVVPAGPKVGVGAAAERGAVLHTHTHLHCRPRFVIVFLSPFLFMVTGNVWDTFAYGKDVFKYQYPGRVWSLSG